MNNRNRNSISGNNNEHNSQDMNNIDNLSRLRTTSTQSQAQSQSSDFRHQRPDANSSRFRRHRYYTQYHINQFYDAAEDEQFYNDEYASLLNTYGNFISNSNAIFARFEAGLRNNISRSITRQYFYYNRYNQLINETTTSPSSNTESDTTTTMPELNTQSPPSLSRESNISTSENREQTTLARRVARALLGTISNEFNLNFPISRDNQNEEADTNRRVRPYAFFFDINTSDISGNNLSNYSNRRDSNVPTIQQIQVATINTRYSHIVNPVNNICPISRDAFNDDSEVIQIRYCKHICNRTDLNNWFRFHSTCPLCRYDIRSYNTNSISNESNNSSRQNNLSNNYRPDLATLDTIINNSSVNNTYDIYNSIIDNSRNFINTIINNITDNEITFSYNIPYQYETDNRETEDNESNQEDQETEYNEENETR